MLNTDLSSYAFLSEAPWVQPLNLTQSNEFGADLFVWRLDRIHPLVNGTKWFKLIGFLTEFKKGGFKKIVTPGGAYSNHLTALATLRSELNCEMEFLIRAWRQERNDRIRFFENQQIPFRFIHPDEYKTIRIKKHFNDPETGLFFIPEGASDPLAEPGLKMLTSFIPDFITHLVLTAGSGQTAESFLSFAPSQLNISIIPVVRDAEMINQLLRLSSARVGKTEIIDTYTFGGFGKSNEKLNRFCRQFYADTNIRIEPVYTGKLFYALIDLVSRGYFNSKEKVLIMHCGGVFNFDEKNGTSNQ